MPVNAWTGQKQTVPRPGWQFYTFIIWAAGFFATGIWFFFSSVQIRRTVVHARINPQTNVIELFQQCKFELGIKQKINIIMQSAIPSPALTGLFKPLLILPEHLNHTNEQTVRHVILHELMHLKNKDLPVIFLLNFLNAVYWFNPFVWIGFKTLRKDMETVCDQRVIQALGQHNRQSYIGTVLQYASNAPAYRLQAAMHINDGKSNMETRIRNMYKSAKTDTGGKIAAVLLATILLAVSVLTACQPTPETPRSQ